ncbi:MAG: hypothetical protein ACJ8FY_23655 [Gemmataceae bacterium]
MDVSGQHERKRLLSVTAGNLRNNHLYVNKHYDFFPSDCIGPCRKRANNEAPQIEIWLDGLEQLIRTDIPRDAKTGKPRGFLRDRKSVGRFNKDHDVKGANSSRAQLSAPRCAEETGAALAAEFVSGIGLFGLADG